MNTNPNRRGLLRGALTAGAVSVAAIPGIAAAEQPDPIFAALEAHKAAFAHFLEFDGSDHETYTAASWVTDAAFNKLKETPPTTRAGMRALLEHLDEWLGETGDFYEYGLLLRSPVLAG